MQCSVRDVYTYIQVGGIPTPLKNDGVKVSWDDYSIPFPIFFGTLKIPWF